MICKENGPAIHAASGNAQNETNLWTCCPNHVAAYEFSLLKTEKHQEGTESQLAQYSKWFIVLLLTDVSVAQRGVCN